MNRSYAPPLTPGQLDALVASSNHLRNMQRRLSKVGAPSNAMPDANPMLVKIDDRFGFGFTTTRAKKSGKPHMMWDRTSSELYPMQAPFVPPALPGTDTRWMQRGDEVVMDK